MESGIGDIDIVRDGFEYSYGRLYAQGRVERIEGSRLRTMFLPRLTPEARIFIRHNWGPPFVRGQLQHYGVHYEEKEISGNGAHLLQRVLKAGKDKVPNHIESLRLQMHMEWLDQIPENCLLSHPEWILEKYFVDGSGEPDRTKTTEVVGIPYPLSSEYRTGQLREAASPISGLHHATGLGSTQTIYLGWDQATVENAAKDDPAKEEQVDTAKADAREAERAAKHKEYVAKTKKSKFGSSVPSPVGRYIVDCEDIKSQWSDMADEMTLAIRATSTPAIYQANFDFGIIEGVMVLSSDEGILDSFCAQQDQDDSGNEDHSEEDDSEDGSTDWEISLGSKRKANATHARPPKKAKVADDSKPEKYFLRLRSRDTGTGEIHPTAEKGTIEFSGPDLSSFAGEADMGCFIGDVVTFTARKISAESPELQESWNDYSETAYKRARVGRWR